MKVNVTFVYFGYFVVTFIMMHRCLANEQYIYMLSTNQTVKEGESYEIICWSGFWKNLAFFKNGQKVSVPSKEYGLCNSEDEEFPCIFYSKDSYNNYTSKLTVKKAEYSPSPESWHCDYEPDPRFKTKTIQITISRELPSTTATPTTTRITRIRTTKREDSTMKIVSTNKQSETDGTEGGQGDEGKAFDNLNIIIMSVSGAVGVIIIFITIVIVICYYTKRKQESVKPTTRRSITNRPFEIMNLGNYDDIGMIGPGNNDWNVTNRVINQDGGMCDTAEGLDNGTYDSAEGNTDPNNLNPIRAYDSEANNSNFDPSVVYGVVNKTPRSEDPNFDPNLLYGVVDKRNKNQSQNVYANQFS